MDEGTKDKWYLMLNYSETKDIIREKLQNMSRDFVAIGFYLKWIRDNELYKQEGYSSIWEFAEDNYGIKRTTVSRWMAMNDKFSEGGNTPILAKEFRMFGKSQLQEMLYLEDNQLDQVTPDMTVKEIREVREPEKEECATSHKTGTCIHRPDFSCTLPEASKLAVGDGIDCNKKCCWDCTKRMECGYRCNSAAGHPIKDEQIPGHMNVEDYPELLPDQYKIDIDINNVEDNDVIKQQENVINQSEPVTEDDENVIDTECKEVAAENAEIEEMCCQKAANLDELTFSQIAIRDYLKKEERTLSEYEKVNSEDGGLPHNLMMRQRMLVKGLRLLMEHEADQDDQEEDDEHEEIEPVQPELPALKNNDQRKEWLKEYKSWGLWYRDENIDVNYYKYDFSDGSRLVVAEYPKRRMYWKPNEFSDEHHYHLLDKHREWYGTDKTFEQQYVHSTDSETSLIEFLKNLQKGEKK